MCLLCVEGFDKVGFYVHFLPIDPVDYVPLVSVREDTDSHKLKLILGSEIKGAQCNTTISSGGSNIYAKSISGANKYRFIIMHTIGGVPGILGALTKPFACLRMLFNVRDQLLALHRACGRAVLTLNDRILLA